MTKQVGSKSGNDTADKHIIPTKEDWIWLLLYHAVKEFGEDDVLELRKKVSMPVAGELIQWWATPKGIVVAIVPPNADEKKAFGKDEV